MDTGTDDLAAVAGLLADRARLLAAHAAGAAVPEPEPTAPGHGSPAGTPGAWGAASRAPGPGPGAGTPGAGIPDAAADMVMVRLARELGAAAGTALRLAVARAQADGHSWQQIGDVLGASPQAAYQRFGRPPEPVDPEPAPPTVTDAADCAVTVLANWFEERYDAVAAMFDETLAGTFPVAGLAEARAHLAGTAGRYRRLGDAEPLVRQAGGYTVADVPLEFESGMLKGRVTFDRSGRVAGLYVLPPAIP
jgi:hypothetical protein